MGKDALVSRRSLFSELVKGAFRLAKEVRGMEEKFREARLLTFESLPILHTYPWELFEDDAKRLGIDVEKVGKDEAIRLIVESGYSADDKNGNAGEAHS